MSASNVADRENKVVCALCSASNDSDSRFCKQCGKSLPRSAVTLAQVELQIETLIKQALDLYDQHRLDESLLACEGVLTLDQENVSALSLKGLIHEKKGQIPLAVEAFEEVVRLNPMSIADKAKLESLKRNEHAPSLKHTTRVRSVWLDIAPTVLAITAGGALLLFGLWLSMRIINTPVAGDNANEDSPIITNNSSAPQPVPPVPQPPSSYAPPSPPAPGPEDNTVNENARNADGGAPLPPITIDPSQLTLAPRTNTPSNGNRSLSGPIPSQPRQPGSTSTPNPLTNPSKEAEDEGSIVMPDVDKQTDTGVYDIQVTRPSGGGSRATGAGSANANNVDNLLRTAQSHQAAGNYQQAIALYQQAVPNLKHPGEILQRIALCYYRLNDKANARQNYQNAILALNQQIQAGIDTTRAREIVQTCQQGLALCEEH